ncbi:MAG: acetate/propionate family kinase [Thermoactinomyces vulgaris]|jgi:acetate kinase|uniref:acetate/propionate family kinase n=1 Tax=Thermoactinomyces TaxID=2023 RepID=UPI000504BB80|nr:MULTISPECIES: acetate kinase [Thermoactinomyces]KFZ40466.1 acetate kinase [Thermoactinomyces sp. Gus2-1]MBH8582380.1 acetate kinase [Thermoactinomyces sp. CICC 10735]MBI0391146.1 acetate kinase [Thermoactinomyces sp. CICC 24226]QCV55571.1 acetate kinase [Thermoactinomyces vulgaris]
MKILVINCGSSSIKYQLFDMKDESVLATGLVEKIGTESSIIKHQVPEKEELVIASEILDHRVGMKKVLDLLMDPEDGVIKSAEEVAAVGHRVVHGGENFSSSVVIDNDVRRAIRETIDLAPLHNPPNLLGIDAAQAQLPHAVHVAVFDTAFHQTMPDYAYMYPLPYVLYRKHKIRRYGFHGTSHKYVSEQAAKFLGRPLDELKIVSCHIGNGASITAVQNGKSVDTSMGMTPLEGLMMGTRSGDIDPAIVPFVITKEDLTLAEVNSMMNKHSGLLGISGISGDMREVTEAMENGNDYARLAIDMYVYKIKKTIGAYIAAMNGVDAILFTAGVGENADLIRERVCEGLTFLGVELDPALNAERSKKERRISTQRSKVDVLVIPTNEELMIARETQALVQ